MTIMRMPPPFIEACERLDCQAYLEQLRFIRSHTRRLAQTLTKVARIHGESSLAEAANEVIAILDAMEHLDPKAAQA